MAALCKNGQPEEHPCIREWQPHPPSSSWACKVPTLAAPATHSKALEHATLPNVSPEERKQLLSFVVVSAGRRCRPLLLLAQCTLDTAPQ